MSQVDLGLLQSDGISHENWSDLPELLGGNQANWKLNACIGKQYTDRMAAHTYAKGYRQAAELIVYNLETERMWMDTLVYPFVFLWRHHFELVLKIIIFEGSMLWEVENGGRQMGHGLHGLWNKAKPICSKIYEDNEQLLADCERLVLELHSLDQAGQTFRYTHDRDENRHLENESLLNISDFNTVASSLSDELELVLNGIDIERANRVDDQHEGG